MMLRNSLKMIVDGNEVSVTVDHNAGRTEPAVSKPGLSFEIKDLNYTNDDEFFLRKAVESVNNHLSDSDYGASQLAADLATSRSTLFKKLKNLTGMNASGFIRSIRLKTARQVLDHNPKMRINILAYEVGFNDPKYFSTCFKNEFGLLPSEYVHQTT